MSKGIVRCERSEGERCGDGGLEAASVAECADEAVVGFEVVWIGCDGGPEGLDGQGSIARCELIHCAQAEFLGGCVRFVHDFFRIKADAVAAKGVLTCPQER